MRCDPPSGRNLSFRPRALRSSTASRSPLCSILVVEGFGVGEANLCALAAGDGELRVSSCKGFAIEQQMNMACRPDTADRRMCGKSLLQVLVRQDRYRTDFARAPAVGEYSMGGSLSGIKPQKLSPVVSAEWALLVSGKMLSRIGDAAGHPVLAGSRRIPVPVIFRGVEFFTGAGGEIGLDCDGSGQVALCPCSSSTSQPSGVLIEAGPAGFTFQQKGGAVAHLRDGSVDAEVPNGCRDEVGASV